MSAAQPSESSAQPSNWNLPNAITIVRIVLAPVFFILLLVDGGHSETLRWVAGILFILAIATDGVDGHIARSRNLVTELGKLLDPIADKVLTGAALVGLSILGELPWWVSIIILVREVGITVYRFAVIRDGVIPASRGGKLKTIFQSIALSAALLPFTQVFTESVPSAVVFWFDFVTMGIAFILTVLSGLDYAVNAVRGARDKQKQQAQPHV